MARNGKTRAGSRSNCSSTMSPVDGGSRGVSDRPGGGEAGSGGYRMWWFALVTLSTLVARPVWAAGEVKPEGTAAAEQSPKFSSAQIEQLVAPIALYPDGLAVQVLMASTYPLEIVRVEPADPQVVYVPTYSPSAVYGPPPAPYYPAMSTYPPGYDPMTTLLTFGAGMAVGAAISGGCDWDDHNVYNNYNNGGGGGGGGNQNININREKNVDRSRNRTNVGGGRQRWEHNPEHRGGVRYRDQASAKKYQGRDQVASRDRATQSVAR